MYDVKREVVAKLNAILPTYYELFADNTTKLPCITYQEVNNSSMYEGDTMRYSRSTLSIKLWGTAISDMVAYGKLIDQALLSLGYKRTSYNELTYNSQVCFIYRYEAITLEQEAN